MRDYISKYNHLVAILVCKRCILYAYVRDFRCKTLLSVFPCITISDAAVLIDFGSLRTKACHTLSMGSSKTESRIPPAPFSTFPVSMDVLIHFLLLVTLSRYLLYTVLNIPRTAIMDFFLASHRTICVFSSGVVIFYIVCRQQVLRSINRKILSLNFKFSVGVFFL